MAQNKFADAFRALADKIEKNDEKDISGAFLVLGPDGKEISGVIIGQPDIASFFGVIKVKLDVAVAEADDAQKRNKAVGR